MATQKKNMVNMAKLYPIFCPYCMKTYPANNVVFRKAKTNNTQPYDLMDDPYLQDYNTQFHKKVSTYLTRTIDPAYIASEDDKSYDENGMLTGVRDVEGDHQIARERLCPYCHNRLYRLAGQMQTHVLSVVGFKGSGKTTYESTLLDVMVKDHIGVLNCSECENPTALDDNIRLIRSGRDVNSTQVEEGPFHYQINFNNGAENFVLNMVDLPGEYFHNPEAIGTSGEAIPNSDTCIFLVDLEQLDEARNVFGTLVSNYRTRLLSGRVNVAVVLYKADKLIERFPQIPAFLSFRQKRDYTDGAPVNMEQVNNNSDAILKYIVQKDQVLGALHTALVQNIPADNLRWFAAFSMNDGKYAPNNVEEPLLWSLAMKGKYPKV